MAATRGKHVLDALHDIERGGAAGFQNADQHAALPVPPDDVGLRREAIADIRHVANVDGRVADHLDREIVDLRDASSGWRSVRRHIRTGRSWPCPTAAADSDSLTAVTTSNGDRPFACSCGRIQIDHDLPLLAAIRIRNHSARNGDQLGAEEVQRDVVQILLLQALAGQGELQNRNARRAVAQNDRRIDAGAASASRSSAKPLSTCATPWSRLA